MRRELLQKKRGLTRTFTLYDDKLVIDLKTFKKNDKFERKLEFIGTEIKYRSENTTQGKILILFCTAIIIFSIIAHYTTPTMSIRNVFGISFLSVCLILFSYFKPRLDDIYLTGGQFAIAFMRDKPNEKEVLDFIEAIKANRKIVLKKIYTHFDSLTDRDEFYATLQWLKSDEIITDEEFTALKHNFDIQKLL